MINPIDFWKTGHSVVILRKDFRVLNVTFGRGLKIWRKALWWILNILFPNHLKNFISQLNYTMKYTLLYPQTWCATTRIPNLVFDQKSYSSPHSLCFKSLLHCVFEADGMVFGHADNWKVLKRKSQSVIPICTHTHTCHGLLPLLIIILKNPSFLLF